MNKFGRFLIVLTVVFTFGTFATPSFLNNNVVEAATKRRTVKEGMTTYTIYDINYYFSNASVKNVVNNYNKMNSSAGKTIQFIMGSINVPLGFMIFARDLTADVTIKPFITAKSKGKGVRIKYEYWLSNVSNSVFKVKNKKITVE